MFCAFVVTAGRLYPTAPVVSSTKVFGDNSTLGSFTKETGELFDITENNSKVFLSGFLCDTHWF